MTDREIKDQEISELERAIKVKAAIVGLSDGERTTIQLAPSELIYSQKEYAEEFHITAKFDISEFERSATEKLVYAQLVVHEDALVNSDKSAFTTEKHLQARGLPIFVFESNDEEQLLKEEGSEVSSAFAGSEIEKEAQHQESADVMTETSELEAKVEKSLEEEKPAEPKEVECLCVHGTCKAGQSECSGRCLTGWSGPHCDTPSESELKNVNRDDDKDYTKDGLYRPLAITDEHHASAEVSHPSSSKKA